MDVISSLENDREILSSHSVAIALITKAVSSIEGLMSQQTISIREIEKAMKSQELLMEKLSNLETRVNDSVNRLHRRIDTTEQEIAEMQRSSQLTCDIVRPMAEKGERVHTGMVLVAKTLGASVMAMLFFLLIWAIKASNYTPSQG